MLVPRRPTRQNMDQTRCHVTSTDVTWHRIPTIGHDTRAGQPGPRLLGPRLTDGCIVRSGMMCVSVTAVKNLSVSLWLLTISYSASCSCLQCPSAYKARAGFTLNRALFRKKCGGPRATNTIIGLQNFLSYLLLQWLSGNFGVLARCRNFFGPHVGAPFLWGPLFGWTCWTCLNPPLYKAS